MKIKGMILVFAGLFFLNACSEKQYIEQNSALIVFKTPVFKYADMGFIYENRDEVKVEIYGSGQALMRLIISKEKVCMSLFECMNKGEFNRKILSAAYPHDILDRIFRGNPLFDGKRVNKNRNGFTQKIISSDKYSIDYSVLNKQIIFRDTINDILIKVKRIE